MVSNERGFYEWIVQRVSALLITLYFVFLFVFIAFNTPLHYAVWHTLFSHVIVKIATYIVVFAILWHAWIGLWTVYTDYIKNRFARLLIEIATLLLLLSYFAWCLFILFR